MAAADRWGAVRQRQAGVVAVALGDHLPFRYHRQPVRAQPQRLDRVACVQHHQRGVAARLQSVAFQPDDPRVLRRHHVETACHFRRMGHLRHMQPHEGHVQHVCGAQRIPRVQHAILPPADSDAMGLHLFHPGQAAPFRERVVPPLQGDVDQRVRDGADAAFGDQRQQLGHVIIVHRMHRGQVRPGRPRAQPVAHRLGRQGLDMAGQGIVGFVAMQVQHQPSVGGDAAEVADRLRAVLHGAFEMRDAADDLDPHIQRADHVVPPGRRAIQPVLRKGDQLQVQIGGDAAAHLQHGLDPAQVVGGGVHMAADRQQAHRHRPVAISDGPVDHVIDAGQIAQFPPQRDPFQQGARGVHARDAIGQGGVQMEMRIDKGRADQIARGLDHPGGGGVHAPHLGDAVAADGDIGHAAVGQRAALDDQIEHQRSPLL